MPSGRLILIFITPDIDVYERDGARKRAPMSRWTAIILGRATKKRQEYHFSASSRSRSLELPGRNAPPAPAHI